MKENINKIEDKDKNKNLKLQPIQTNKDISKNKIFVSEKLNFPQKDNEHIKKKNIKFLSIKRQFFKVQTFSDFNRKKPIPNPNINDGRWTEDERNKFIQGISLYGINWKKVKSLIPTRTAVQVRSHAQKFFYKMKACKDDSLGIDFTLSSINNVKDMINQIKNINPHYNVINVLKKLSNKFITKKRKFKTIHKKIIKNQNNYILDNNDNNDLFRLEEDNNLISNENDQILNALVKNGKNKILEQNNFNNNISNFELIRNNFINNNFNNFQNLLNNPLPLGGENNLSFNNIFNNNNFNNNLLKNYLPFNLANDPYISYLSIINNYLFSNIQNLNSIYSIGNIFISNLINEINYFNNNIASFNNMYLNNNISLINNNNISQSNVNKINNNNLLNQINEIKDKKENNNL